MINVKKSHAIDVCEVKPMYDIVLFKNKKDNVADIRDSLTFDEIADLFNEHMVTDDKDTIMYCMAKFKSEDEFFEPATKKIYADNKLVSVEAILDQNGNKKVGRLASNIVSINCLVLDYDGEMTLEAARKRFSEYKHIGYSSFNHRVSGVDKFRVIIPLNKPITPDGLRARKADIHNFIGASDGSTLSIGRAFYMPSHLAENQCHSTYWYNDVDNFLDWTQFREKKVKLHQYTQPKIAPTINGNGRILYETLDVVQFFKDRGLYIRDNGNGKHEVVCPKCHEHTNRNKTGTVVFEGGSGEWPNIYCSHTHGFSNKDFWEYFKQLEGDKCFDNYCLRENLQSTSELQDLARAKLIKIFGRDFK